MTERPSALALADRTETHERGHVPDVGVVWQTAPGPMEIRLGGGALPHYSRCGFVIGLDQWAELHSNREYKCLAQTNVGGDMWVSTVWLGLDHGFGSGPPLIFETMVFGDDTGWMDLDMTRYATEEAAYVGHDQTVTMVRLELEVWRHGND